MSIYTVVNPPPGSPWYFADIQSVPLLPPTSTLVIVGNSDGTQTRIIGTGFTFSGNTATGGTITEIDRSSTDGGTIYETVTGLNHSLVTFLGLAAIPPASESFVNKQAFAFIFNGS